MSSIYSPSTNTFLRKSATSAGIAAHLKSDASVLSSSCISLTNQSDQKKWVFGGGVSVGCCATLRPQMISENTFVLPVEASRLPRRCLEQQPPLIYTPAARRCRAGQQGVCSLIRCVRGGSEKGGRDVSITHVGHTPSVRPSIRLSVCVKRPRCSLHPSLWPSVVTVVVSRFVLAHLLLALWRQTQWWKEGNL